MLSGYFFGMYHLVLLFIFILFNFLSCQVVYLDHIDFRQRQVADFIPRISVWKQDMIQFYCSLDLKSPGVYGYRPLLEFEKTCYYKVI
jgi:hypothetical protein